MGILSFPTSVRRAASRVTSKSYRKREKRRRNALKQIKKGLKPLDSSLKGKWKRGEDLLVLVANPDRKTTTVTAPKTSKKRIALFDVKKKSLAWAPGVKGGEVVDLKPGKYAITLPPKGKKGRAKLYKLK